MSKLGELHREEDKARLELEKASKKAQAIKMSIPDLKAKQSREQEDELKDILRKENVKIERKTIELAESLAAETEIKLKELSGNADILEKAATKHLKEYILVSGSEG